MDIQNELAGWCGANSPLRRSTQSVLSRDHLTVYRSLLDIAEDGATNVVSNAVLVGNDKQNALNSSAQAKQSGEATRAFAL